MKHRYSILFLALALIAGASQPMHAQSKKGKKNKETANTKQPSEELRNVSIADMYIDAQREKMLGNFSEAIKAFEALLKYEPANDAAHYELGNLYLSAAILDQALQHSREAVKLQPDNKWYQYSYANALTSLGKYYDAATVYKQILEKNARDLNSYGVWANLLMKADRPEEAIDVWNKYEQMDGLSETTTQEKVKIYMALGKEAEAATEIEKLHLAYPSKAEYAVMLADYYRTTNQKEKAAAIYQELLKYDANSPYALLYLASEAEDKNDTALYMRYMQKAFASKTLELDKKIKILYEYIQNYEAHKLQQSQAIRLARQLTAVYPDDAKTFAILGDLYYLNDSLQPALSSYKLSLGLRQDVYAVWEQSFAIALQLKQYDFAREQCDKALEYYPNSAGVYYYKGLACKGQKDYPNAITSLQTGLKRSLSDKTQRAQIFVALAESYVQLKQLAESDSCYEQAIALQPDNAYTLNNYAYVLAERGSNLTNAAGLSLRAVGLQPTNPAFLDTYAWILFRQEKYDDALRWQQKALQSADETSTELYEHMGDIQFKLGNVNEALNYWQKACERDCTSALLKKKIENKTWFSE